MTILDELYRWKLSQIDTIDSHGINGVLEQSLT